MDAAHYAAVCCRTPTNNHNTPMNGNSGSRAATAFHKRAIAV